MSSYFIQGILNGLLSLTNRYPPWVQIIKGGYIPKLADCVQRISGKKF